MNFLGAQASVTLSCEGTFFFYTLNLGVLHYSLDIQKYKQMGIAFCGVLAQHKVIGLKWADSVGLWSR